MTSQWPNWCSILIHKFPNHLGTPIIMMAIMKTLYTIYSLWIQLLNLSANQHQILVPDHQQIYICTHLWLAFGTRILSLVRRQLFNSWICLRRRLLIIIPPTSCIVHSPFGILVYLFFHFYLHFYQKFLNEFELDLHYCQHKTSSYESHAIVESQNSCYIPCIAKPFSLIKLRDFRYNVLASWPLWRRKSVSMRCTNEVFIC